MNKILHRIFFNFDDGPDPFLPYLETWKKQLPDFEIMLWDKSNLPLDLNAFTRKMAAEKNHAFLSDYFRCWLLKRYGGAYLDADIEILDGGVFRTVYEEAQTADSYSLFIGIESVSTGGLTPHSMGVRADANYEILDFLMSLYENVFSGPMGHLIRKFPMPDLMSLYFLKAEKEEGYSLTKNGCFTGHSEILVTKGIKIYPQTWFSPVIKRGGDKIIAAFDENTCMCHHFAATWKKSADGNQCGKLFVESLRDNDYAVDPSSLTALRRRYGEQKIRPAKVKWRFSEKEIRFLEDFMNFLVPYGGIRYKFMKKLRK